MTRHLDPERKAQVWRQGVRRLRDWLPAARAEAERAVAAGEPSGFKPVSALANAAMSFYRAANLQAIVIYPAPKGGWHGDLVFKNMPDGVSNTLGTRTLLHGILVRELIVKEAAPAEPVGVFELYGYDLSFPLAIIERAKAAMPAGARAGYGSVEAAVGRIGEVLADLCPEGFPQSDFDTWPRDKQIILMSVLVQATCDGVLRYPPFEDAAPDPDRSRPVRVRVIGTEGQSA